MSSRQIIRSYSTFSRRRMPPPKQPMGTPTPETAMSQSAPLEVRKRRILRKPKLAEEWDHTNSEGLTISEAKTFHRRRVLGLDKSIKVDEPGDQGLWAYERRTRRERIRGLRVQPAETEDASVAEDAVNAVGQKIFLPNIVFTMVRNATPVGQPYNPYEATFRLPQAVTKTDIRSYLKAVYDVDVTYIRTDNYIAKPVVQKNAKRPYVGQTQRGKAHRTFKRAVVGLKEPFYFPAALDKEALDAQFGVSQDRDAMAKQFIEQYRRNSDPHTWRWRGEPYTSRGRILEAISKRKQENSKNLATAKQAMLAKQAKYNGASP